MENSHGLILARTDKGADTSGAARELRRWVEHDDPEFTRQRQHSRVGLLRRQAAELQSRALELLRLAESLEHQA